METRIVGIDTCGRGDFWWNNLQPVFSPQGGRPLALVSGNDTYTYDPDQDFIKPILEAMKRPITIFPYFNGTKRLIFKFYVQKRAIPSDIPPECNVVKTKFFLGEEQSYVIMEGGTSDLSDLQHLGWTPHNPTDFCRRLIEIINCLVHSSTPYLYPDMKVENIVKSKCEEDAQRGRPIVIERPILIDIDEVISLEQLKRGEYSFTRDLVWRRLRNKRTEGFKVCVTSLLLTIFELHGGNLKEYMTYADVIIHMSYYSYMIPYIIDLFDKDATDGIKKMNEFEDFKQWVESISRLPVITEEPDDYSQEEDNIFPSTTEYRDNPVQLEDFRPGDLDEMEDIDQALEDIERLSYFLNADKGDNRTYQGGAFKGGYQSGSIIEEE